MISYAKWVRSCLQSFLLMWHHDMQTWSTCGLSFWVITAVLSGIPHWLRGRGQYLRARQEDTHNICNKNIIISTISWPLCEVLLLLLGVVAIGPTEALWAGQGKVGQDKADLGWFVQRMGQPWLPVHLPTCWPPEACSHANTADNMTSNMQMIAK